MLIRTPTSSPVFRYPENVGQPPVDKWILFSAKKGRHIIRSKKPIAEDRTLASVALYLPEGALRTSIDAGWQGTDVGTLLGAAVEAADGFGEKLINVKLNASSLKEVGADGIETLKDITSGMGGITGMALEVLKTSFMEHFSQNYSGAVGAATGKVINPKTDMLFTAVQYRDHEFEFTLVPRNIQEARAINNIVHFFQYYMLPSFGKEGLADGADDLKISSFMIGFPHEFEISMRSGTGELQHVNRIGRSVLKNCTVNHAGADKVSFIKDGDEYYPTVTKLALQFSEVRLLGRDSDEIARPGKQRLEDREG